MNAGLTTSGVAILFLAYRVFAAVKGKKFVSSCCGRNYSAGVSVVPMTPPSLRLERDEPKRIHEAPAEKEVSHVSLQNYQASV